MGLYLIIPGNKSEKKAILEHRARDKIFGGVLINTRNELKVKTGRIQGEALAHVRGSASSRELGKGLETTDVGAYEGANGVEKLQ